MPDSRTDLDHPEGNGGTAAPARFGAVASAVGRRPVDLETGLVVAGLGLSEPVFDIGRVLAAPSTATQLRSQQVDLTLEPVLALHQLGPTRGPSASHRTDAANDHGRRSFEPRGGFDTCGLETCAFARWAREGGPSMPSSMTSRSPHVLHEFFTGIADRGNETRRKETS